MVDQLPPVSLDIFQDPAQLTADLIDIYSVSGQEQTIAEAIENALSPLEHLEIIRDGNAVIARTSQGKDQRIILAGHLDTVPLPTSKENQKNQQRGTVPSVWAHDSEEPDSPILYGRGATDMKGGVALQLALAAHLTNSPYDITYIFYDNEEVESSLNGLGRLSKNHPELLDADFGILLEPTDGTVEGGCNGTARFKLSVDGVAAHSARAWKGDNAIHKLATILQRLKDYQPQTVTVDGLEYREGLNAVRVYGGVAGNVIPDSSSVEINYRFAPDKNLGEIRQNIEGLFGDIALIEETDMAPGARPGLDDPIAQSFVQSIGQKPKPKYGWTDVSRLSSMGVPAVNFGPGDPMLAHSDDEHVSTQQIRQMYYSLKKWLSA